MDMSTREDVLEHGEASPQVLDQASLAFEERWSHLVSVTNWEKGRIILEWRNALMAAGADAREYADEAWSRRVGGVSGQHVGRLRRVHERFGKQRSTYPGLYWSHFQASLDWNDAEMWLEGAVQNRWSVQSMREQRLEALGGAAEDAAPVEMAADFDEDATGAEQTSPAENFDQHAFQEEVFGPDLDAGPDFGDEGETRGSAERSSGAGGDSSEITAQSGAVAAPRPFEDMPELPVDLAEAFELFKLSILRHKAKGWTEIAMEDALYIIGGLKDLILAPAE